MNTKKQKLYPMDWHIPSYLEQVELHSGCFDKMFEEPMMEENEKDEHSWYCDQALFRLEQIRIPSAMDWHIAMARKRLLESHGYRLEVGYPFDCCGPFVDAYEEVLLRLGYEEECNEVSFAAYDEFMALNEVKPEDVELPF